jgi:hypothetical protein
MLYPQRGVSSGYFHGYSCVHKDTVHFDSTQTHHLLPLERGRLQLMYGVISTTRPLQSTTQHMFARGSQQSLENLNSTVNLLFVCNWTRGVINDAGCSIATAFELGTRFVLSMCWTWILHYSWLQSLWCMQHREYRAWQWHQRSRVRMPVSHSKYPQNHNWSGLKVWLTGRPPASSDCLTRSSLSTPGRTAARGVFLSHGAMPFWKSSETPLHISFEYVYSQQNAMA